MKVQVTEFPFHGSSAVVAIVESRYTLGENGKPVLRQVAAHFPGRPVMLVSVEPNGFRAYAPFQTGQLLALLQLEELRLREIDLAEPPSGDDTPLPF
ncbi:hypothetical protein G4G28_22875 [Massilia sp. Dwa41.01b]|uniref:hypothetical protein n=1 Tax=unclassified Massilia TaxID=2609279 RepID=UPI0016018B80|nr:MULTISPECIES: hypothetical protein [unclassified Massilia]QNA90643.1 hypothetical protein G4G28_22875 [Massilia sp. Dwa41.01b]QNA97873.1 hypothetical protein G4G31_01945 [Massilia sp. Se16.2.3]